MELKAWLDQHVGDGPKLFSTADLLCQIDGDIGSNHQIGKADLNLLAAALDRCGYGLEPDPSINYPTTASSTDAVVFRSASSRSEVVRPQFLAALAHADIGLLIATATGGVSAVEQETLRRQVAENQDLLEAERKRLIARFVLLAKQPPTLRILRLFKDRPTADREAVARLAVTVATAGGRQDPEAVQLLEKVYNALNLPLPKLYSLLQSLGLNDERLPTVAPADTARSVPIPPRPVTDDGPIALNQDRLARTRAETAVVSTILGEIFSEADESAIVPTVEPAADYAGGATSASGPAFDGLDPKYVPVLQAVVDHGSMARKEFEELVAEHHLMCDGALEAINDWAFDKLGDVLLDDGQSITVNAHLLHQNRQAAE